MAAQKTKRNRKTKSVKSLKAKRLSPKRAQGVKGGAQKSKSWDWIK